MTRPILPLRAVFALSLGAASLAGCKAKTPPPEPAAPAPAPAPAPLAVAAIETAKSVGADKRITAPASVFGVRDTIYVSVATTGAAPSAALHAHWSFETGQLVDSSTVSIAPTGPAATEFHIVKASPWPVGKYKVAIFLNDQPAGEREFEVRK